MPPLGDIEPRRDGGSPIILVAVWPGAPARELALIGQLLVLAPLPVRLMFALVAGDHAELARDDAPRRGREIQSTRSRGPTSMPARSTTAMNSSSSIGERCSRSGMPGGDQG